MRSLTCRLEAIEEVRRRHRVKVIRVIRRPVTTKTNHITLTRLDHIYEYPGTDTKAGTSPAGTGVDRRTRRAPYHEWGFEIDDGYPRGWRPGDPDPWHGGDGTREPSPDCLR